MLADISWESFAILIDRSVKAEMGDGDGPGEVKIEVGCSACEGAVYG